MTSESVTLGGVRTQLHTWGPASGPTLVVLHSAGLTGRSLRWFAEQLVLRGHRVLAPDLRGHGGSSATPSEVTLSSMADDVIELGGRLESPARLVGTSMGGVVAGLAAARSPRTWADLSVVCSPDRGYPAFADRATAVADGGMDGHVEITVARWFTGEQVAEGHAGVVEARRSLAAMDPACWDAVWRDFATFQGWLDLRGLVELHALAGAADVSTPRDVVARVVQRAGGRLDVLTGAPHQLLMTHPARSADLLTA